MVNLLERGAPQGIEGGPASGTARADEHPGPASGKGAPVRASRKRRSRWDPSMQRQLERLVRRAGREALLERAHALPPAARALVAAHLEKGMTLAEIAVLHGVTPRQMRRRLTRLCELLNDPCCALTARLSQRLSPATAALARAYWLEETPLRALAAQRRQTLYRLRQDLALARMQLLVEYSREQALSAEMDRAPEPVGGHERMEND